MILMLGWTVRDAVAYAGRRWKIAGINRISGILKTDGGETILVSRGDDPVALRGREFSEIIRGPLPVRQHEVSIAHAYLRPRGDKVAA